MWTLWDYNDDADDVDNEYDDIYYSRRGNQP